MHHDAPPTRSQWFLAVALSVVSNVTGTFGAFMPLKAVFILAADSVPSIFPSFMVDAGPVVAALSLLAAGAIFLIVSGSAKKLAATLSPSSEKMPLSDRLIGQGAEIATRPERITLGEFANIGVAALMMVGTAYVSLTLVSLVVIWAAISATVLAFIILRRDRRPPYPTGRAEFAAEFKSWVALSSLWSTIGAAIVTLIFDYPELGLTGILLGFVMMDRMQKSLGELGRLLLPRRDSGEKTETATVTIPVAPLATGAPIDFLASPNGQRLFKLSLEKNGLSSSRWRLVGQPNRNQGSILVDDEAGHPVLLRVFAADRHDRHKREIDFRHSTLASSPFPHSEAIDTVIAGLPAILVRFAPGYEPEPDRHIDQSEAGAWQIRWEVECITDDATQRLLQRVAVDDPADFALAHLNVLSVVKGPHQAATRDILRTFTQLRSLYLNGPRVYSLGAPISPKSFLPLGGGALEPLDCSVLSVTLHGATWGSPGIYHKAFAELARGDERLETMVRAVAVRHCLVQVGKRASSRDTASLVGALEELTAAVQDLET